MEKYFPDRKGTTKKGAAEHGEVIHHFPHLPPVNAY